MNILGYYKIIHIKILYMEVEKKKVELKSDPNFITKQRVSIREKNAENHV